MCTCTHTRVYIYNSQQPTTVFISLPKSSSFLLHCVAAGFFRKIRNCSSSTRTSLSVASSRLTSSGQTASNRWVTPRHVVRSISLGACGVTRCVVPSRSAPETSLAVDRYCICSRFFFQWAKFCVFDKDVTCCYWVGFVASEKHQRFEARCRYFCRFPSECFCVYLFLFLYMYEYVDFSNCLLVTFLWHFLWLALSCMFVYYNNWYLTICWCLRKEAHSYRRRTRHILR